jgi:hypothetical protein
MITNEPEGVEALRSDLIIPMEIMVFIGKLGAVLHKFALLSSDFEKYISVVTFSIAAKSRFPLLKECVGFSKIEKGADALDLSMISKCTSLKSLNASLSLVDDCGLSHITIFSMLTTINLSYTAINDKMLRHLSALTNITSLNISHNTFLSGKGLLHLTKNINLKSLDISGCSQIMAEGMGYLSVFTNLTKLDVKCCATIDWALPDFSKLISLSHLDLSGAAVTNMGLLHITQCTNLTKLDVSNTFITWDKDTILAKFSGRLTHFELCCHPVKPSSNGVVIVQFAMYSR